MILSNRQLAKFTCRKCDKSERLYKYVRAQNVLIDQYFVGRILVNLFADVYDYECLLNRIKFKVILFLQF